ncbi:MAG: hypothetical protein LBN95_07940 [Prevotellaceae bacterium]|jgi:hypothetical protein|nr:hypothetical protein [Prevotellaceae bacterium]
MNKEKRNELYDRAVKFLNSKEKSVPVGMSILKEANYKPNVIAMFEKNIQRRDIALKVVNEIRLFLRFLRNPNNVIHQDEPSGTETDADNKHLTFVSNMEQELAKEYPAEIKKVLTEYYNLYTQRSIFHNSLKKVGEGNTEPEIKERKRIANVIDAVSLRMETLWQIFEAFKADGNLPAEEFFTEPFDPEKIIAENKKKNAAAGKKIEIDLKTLPLKKLQKMKETLRIKISKNENKLEFQSEKKLEKPNPMPMCPKRVEIEKKLVEFKDLKLKIEFEIAEKK